MNVSLRIEDDILKRLDKVAEALDRPRSWVANEAIEQFLTYQDWFVAKVNKAIAEADNGGATISHDAVVERAKQRQQGRTK